MSGRKGFAKGRRPLGAVWWGMKQRCLNPSHSSYSRYGGRGVTICERWMDYENFAADMGPRPTGTTLDRIDSHGNYEPSNCRWATREQQDANRSLARGRENGRSTLNEEVIRRIRALSAAGVQMKDIAKIVGTHKSTIGPIVHRRAWSHVS